MPQSLKPVPALVPVPAAGTAPAPWPLRTGRTAALSALLLLAAGCTTTGSGESTPARVIAVTADNQIVEFVAGRPERIVARRSLTGIQSGERITGIDFRPSNGRLYAIGDSGQLYVLDLSTGIAERVGNGGFRTLASGDIGMDFNPAADRLRLVGAAGTNLRIHPETGAVIDADAQSAGLQIDGPLAYAEGQAQAGRTARLVASAYSNSRPGAVATTNYAIDAASGTLVTQGSREGATPAVSPDTGQLVTVGPLGVDLGKGPVSFDIGPGNLALISATTPGGRSELYRVNLDNGAASRLGPIGIGGPVTAIAIVPVTQRSAR
jgi:outer membrane protein assembly factor BamB